VAVGCVPLETVVCRVAQAVFPTSLSSAYLARRWTAGRLRSWELSELADTVMLLTSELVTNAVIHAGSGPIVSLAVAEATIEVGVADGAVRHPLGPSSGREVSTPPTQTPGVAEEGRGLYLVQSIAAAWGVSTQPEGKQIWFRLDAADWAYRSDCRCRDSSVDLVALASGRFANAAPGPWDRPVGPD
jgi:sigma-B regulation protein RsbU (phosphoserine phosphatase)